MKKTLIALLALGSVAMAAEYTEAITLPSTSTFWTRSISGVPQNAGWADATATKNISGDNVYKVYVAPTQTNSIYYGCANGVDGTGNGDIVVSTAEDKSISFNIAARGGNGGEVVAITLSMDTVISAHHSAADELTSVTFSFTSDVANNAAYSVWGYTDGETSVSNIGGVQGMVAGTNTITITAEQLDGVNELVFVLGNNKNNINVSGLSVTAMFTEKSSPGPVVPEPATGSLSLLALAGLCARRRRK